MKDNELVKETVSNYFEYLYETNTDAIINLYVENAVLMPADMPTAKGKSQLHTAYNQTFGVVKFVSATIDYDEISVYGDMAIVRTTSDVNLFMINEKQDVKNKMREFFILNKENGDWKISRYMFNRVL
jgi:ketosteroid isomerase-like protein